ncbi:hypothetical protein, partial [Pseudomonas sp. R5(2019)]|uniref:hypothetical protein n=1 Tax=Pseudomonas sp. R5(2019) TaxID=2697566 RepID=UPI001C498493
EQTGLVSWFALDIRHKKMPASLDAGHFLKLESEWLGFHTVCTGVLQAGKTVQPVKLPCIRHVCFMPTPSGPIMFAFFAQ